MRAKHDKLFLQVMSICCSIQCSLELICDASKPPASDVMETWSVRTCNTMLHTFLIHDN